MKTATSISIETTILQAARKLACSQKRSLSSLVELTLEQGLKPARKTGAKRRAAA